MGFANIPVRTNDIDSQIDASWFNSIRTELVAAFGSGGYIATEPLQTVSNGGVLTYSTNSFKPLLRVVGQGGAVTTSPTPFGATHSFGDGAEIIVIGTSNTNTVTFPENDIVNGVVNASGGDIVLSRYSYVLFIYDATLQRFIATTSGGETTLGVHENLGTGNGSQTVFALSTLPLSSDSFLVFFNNTVVPRSEYTFSNPNITFNTAPAAGQVVRAFILSTGTASVTPASGSRVVEYRTVTASENSNHELTLNNVPSVPTNVLVDVLDGSTQEYGVDFTVSSNNVSWLGLGMDNDVTTGTKIRFVYET